MFSSLTPDRERSSKPFSVADLPHLSFKPSDVVYFAHLGGDLFQFKPDCHIYVSFGWNAFLDAMEDHLDLFFPCGSGQLRYGSCTATPIPPRDNYWLAARAVFDGDDYIDYFNTDALTLLQNASPYRVQIRLLDPDGQTMWLSGDLY